MSTTNYQIATLITETTAILTRNFLCIFLILTEIKT